MALTKREDYNGYMRRFMKRRYHRRRKSAIKQLGGECVRCGSKKKLEFDHRDPKSKSFSIWSRGVSESRLVLEIAKCQLLCAKCHLLKTLSDLGRRLHKGTHGTLSAYPYCGPKKCKRCRAAKAEWNRGYRRRRKGLGLPDGSRARHGIVSTYRCGCRCKPCAKANSKSMAEYYKKCRRML